MAGCYYLYRKNTLDSFAAGAQRRPDAGRHQRIHGGKGVVYIYGNYGGDVMNFDMAAEMAAFDDIEVRTVLVKDDVASAPPDEAARRRGVAGMVFAFKIGGAKADQGGSLDEVVAVTEKALANIRTMGVALSPCTVPRAGKPTFTIGEDEMEIGMGIHGEPGMKREKLQSADEITERMMTAILDDLQARSRRPPGRDGQRPGRHAARRTVHHLPQGARPADGHGHRHSPGLCWRVCHLHGDGRRLADADAGSTTNWPRCSITRRTRPSLCRCKSINFTEETSDEICVLRSCAQADDQ